MWRLWEDPIEDESREDHGEAKDLTHGEKIPKESYLRVRLPEKLNDEAEYPITDQEKTNQGTRLQISILQFPQDDKQDQAFKGSLIKLRGVPRHRPPRWKHHGPGNFSGATEELAIDEISNPSQTETDGGGDSDGIGHLPAG